MKKDKEPGDVPVSEQHAYEASLDRYHALKDRTKTMEEKIRASDIEDLKTTIEIARNMKIMEMDMALIVDTTGLTEDEINQL